MIDALHEKPGTNRYPNCRTCSFPVLSGCANHVLPAASHDASDGPGHRCVAPENRFCRKGRSQLTHQSDLDSIALPLPLRVARPLRKNVHPDRSSPCPDLVGGTSLKNPFIQEIPCERSHDNRTIVLFKPSGRMSYNENSMEQEKDPAAQALGKKRWANITGKQRTKEMTLLAAARWAGHVAKRPASSRKPAAKKGKA